MVKIQKAPEYFIRVFSDNNPSEEDFQKVIKLEKGKLEIGTILDFLDGENQDELNILKNLFLELKGSNADVFYTYLNNFEYYQKKIFFRIIEKIEEHKNKMYKEIKPYFNKKIPKVLFLYVLIDRMKDLNESLGIFDIDVLDILNTNGERFSFLDSSPRYILLQKIEELTE
uniref:Uncharacterized protein n=1 Tax=viral metagenome TaxID=1070528 RepID=A0A6C0AEI8_9ZZZZ